MLFDSVIYQKTLEQSISILPDKDSSFLITGATGLIGSFIVDLFHCANLHGHSHHVYALGRSIERLQKRFCYHDDLITLVQQDVCDPFSDKLPNADYVIHAASNADPRTYAQYPAETLLTNVYGTRNVLEYCRKCESKLVLLSTFEVYGKAADRDVYDETSFGVIDANSIRSCYPESKRCAEILVRCYTEEYGIKGVIARLCSIYGPTMLASDNKAHAQFIRNAVNNEDIVLKSAGSQRRSYLYVADAVSAIFAILTKGSIGEAYNVSNENSVATIAEVAREASKIAGTKVVYQIPDETESRGYSKPQNCILNNTKLKDLGWNGKYSLSQGLKETIDILR